MHTLINGMRTNISNGSGLARTSLGAPSKRVAPRSLATVFAAWILLTVAVTCFMDRTACL